MTVSATYSPQDDKLRVYFVSRQGDDVIQPLRDAGFRWAGAQECWFAVWTPEREDACFAVGAESIDDEPSTLEERAEARADRFEGYVDSAKQDSADGYATFKGIHSCIPFGQPILVGHHSERRHRRDLERADNGMRKAIEADKRAGYWASRAEGAVRWARYKEAPGVRARRIKGLEAEARKIGRNRSDLALLLQHFTESAPFGKLLALANIGRSVPYGVWGKLDKLKSDPNADIHTATATDPAAVLEIVRSVRVGAEKCDAVNVRWQDHLAGRIAYEKDQLGEQGAAYLLDKKPRPKQPPLLNIRDGAHPMTAAEYAAIWRDYKGTRTLAKGTPNAYRVRSALVTVNGARNLCRVFLTDKREDTMPTVAEQPDRKVAQ